ncbi:hypothetical protein [Bradyrhizobium sp. Cp5.3]|uniref:hypothetical protein n=1 Tax=Bradyrhizobium sp. Cp5.3 TaxID=443598 RepID=UPI001FDAB774|nr:hypothetical protein [Bradyrhizobium sp. Cp5.3]
MTFRVFGVMMLSLLFATVLMPLTVSKRYRAAPVSHSAQSSFAQHQLPDRESG